MKINILTICCLLFSSTVFSQLSYKRVIDETGKPVTYANITVSSVRDSTFICGTVSDSLGIFSLHLDDSQEIILKVSCLGYKTYISTVQPRRIEDVVLKKTSYLLAGVEVTTSPNLFKMKGNSVIATVENSVLSKMDKLINILPYIPYVQVTQEGIQVMGRGKPLIYINNHQLSDNQELARIDASDIKNIEIITSPGAEYDASVNAVIKIRVKRKSGEGISGSANLLLAQAKYTSETTYLNLNYRKKQLDIFGLVGFRDTRTQKETYKSSILKDEKVYSQNYNSTGKEHWLGVDGNVGFNLELDNKNELGAKYVFMHSPKLVITSLINEQLYSGEPLLYSLHSNSHNERELTTHSVNSYYNRKFDDKTNLKINVDFSTSRDQTHQTVFEIYEGKGSRTVSSEGTYNYKFYAGKAVLEHYFNKGKALVGGEYSNTNYKQSYINHTPELEVTIPPSDSHSKQNISALFAEYTLNIKKWNLVTGLRYEHTSFLFYLDKIKQEDQNYYDNRLFPYLSISGNIKNVNLSLSYNNKIARPGYYSMRGNVEYNSPFDYTQGNPALKATIRHSVTGLISCGNFQGMITYNYQKNPIISIVEQYNGLPAILTHPVNIDKNQSIQVIGEWSKKIKFWTPFVSASFTKPFLTLNMNGGTYRFNHVNSSFSIRNIMSLNESIYFYINGTYDTKGNYNIYMYKPSGELQVGVSKTFLQNKLSVSIWYCDVFKTNKNKYDLYLGNLQIHNKTYQGTCMGMLSVIYRFNSTPATRYKGTGAAIDERNRL